MIKSLSELLSNPELKGIIDKSSHLARLDQQLQAQLAFELRPHCQVMDYQLGILTIQVDTATWATWLRYQSAQLMIQLSQSPSFQKLKQIKVKVRPIGNPNENQPQTREPLSSQTKQLLEQTAIKIKDNRLRESLQRLAKSGSDCGPNTRNK